MSHTPSLLRTSLLTLVVAAVAALALGCGPKVPPPPAQFADTGRVPTGDSLLEYRIAEAARLGEITVEERQAMGKKLLRGSVEESILNDYIGATVGQGDLGEAIDLLHTLAVRNPADELAVANALNLAMGRLQWKACASMADSYLRQRLNRGVFLIRALCLERSGDPVEAKENFEAALAPSVNRTGPITPEEGQALYDILGERGGSRPAPPAKDELVYRFEPVVKRAGILETLFLSHLLNRFDASLKVGNVNWGSLNGQELKSVVLSRAQAYRHCYRMADAEARRSARPAGHSTFTFFVGPLGQIQDIKVAESRWMKTGVHPQEGMFNECVIEQLSRLVFPRPRYSHPVPAQHRLSFQPD